jgi:hypothetical protein
VPICVKGICGWARGYQPMSWGACAVYRIFGSIFCVFSLISCAQRPLPFERLEVFQREGLYGYRNAERGVVIVPRYYVAHDFNAHGIAAVADDSGWAYIDQKGEIIVRPFVFDNGPDYFQEQVARYTVGDKFGFFDEEGKVVIDPRFDFALPFSDGLAAVCEGCVFHRDGEHGSYEGGKWGYIDHRGNLAIGLQFDRAHPFVQGKARVQKGKEWFTVDRHGALGADDP